MTGFELTILLFAVVVVLALVGRGLSTPLPVVFALGGLGLGLVWRFVPLPHFAIAPQLTLALFLPPLIVAAAYAVPLGAFRANFRPIMGLAVVLVLVTMGVTAIIARAAIPGLPWAAALVLGAVVAPPDPVAATTVGSKLGLENRLVTILAGEGLVNDATALVAYQIAVTAAVSGLFSWSQLGIELLRAVPVGLAVGFAVGWLSTWLLRRIDEPVLETAISLLVPYAAYIAAERLGGSTILALVALGFHLKLRLGESGTPATRLAGRNVWRVVDFAAGGLVFVLVGVELGTVVTLGTPVGVLRVAALVVGSVVVMRMLWMHTIPHALELVSKRAGPAFPFGQLTVLGWAGMRGVVSLVLALSIPQVLASGEPFPMRGQLIVIAVSVVVATLIGQGLTLAPLIRYLGIDHPRRPAREERDARESAVAAARSELDQLVRTGELSPVQRDGLAVRLGRSVGLGRELQGASDIENSMTAALLLALARQRRVVLQRVNDGRISDDAAEHLQEILDADELRLNQDADGDRLAAQEDEESTEPADG